MAEAYYEPTPATDGATMNPVPGAVFQVFEITDTTFSTPLSLRVGSGNPTTTITASESLATLPGVYVTSPNFEHIWKSGTFEWRRDSIDGAKAAIEAAKISASDSAISAAASEQSARDAANLVDAPADTAVKTLLDDAASQTRIAANKLFTRGVDVTAHGVVADGVADDKVALQAALDAGAASGVPVVLPARRPIAVSGTVTIPAGSIVYTNGAKFKTTANLGRAPVLIIQDRVIVVGGLDAEVTSGVGAQGVTITGATVAIDSVWVKGTAAGAGSGNVRDNALAIQSGTTGNVIIGSVELENFDWSFRIETAARTVVGDVQIKTYVTGILDYDGSLTVGSGYIRGASPNASYSSGHNGVLLESRTANLTHDIHLSNVTVENSGEHAFRLGGTNLISRVWFTNCTARNVGGSGFKTLGGSVEAGNYHEDIYFTDCHVEDAGQVNQNTCGFLLQMARNVHMNGCTVRKRNKTSSATEALRIGGGVHGLYVNGFRAYDAFQRGINLEGEYGANSNVFIRNADVQSATGWPLYVDYTLASFDTVQVDGHFRGTASDAGAAYAGRTAGTFEITGESHLALRIAAASTLSFAASSRMSGFLGDCTGPFASAPAFANGSTWTDRATGVKYLRKAGAWAAL